MRIFGRTVPLWATLFPLALAVGAYWGWWDARLETYRRELAPWVGANAVFGGFPYRLHAAAGPVTLGRRGTDTSLGVSAHRVTVDRQPLAMALSVIGLERVQVRALAPGFATAGAILLAPRARASVNVDSGRLARLSTEFFDPVLTSALLPATMRAALFELHLRETPVAPIALPTGPAMPVQAELRLAGEGVRLDGGDPLGMEADIAVTAAAPLRSVRGWAAQSGTVELRRLRLWDKGGTVAEVSATVVPHGGVLEIAGTVTTVCPRAVLALLDQRPAAGTEYRARTPQRIAFGGPAGAVMAKLDTAGLGAWTVRAQEAACPVLRR